MRDELAKQIKNLILGPLNGKNEKLNFRPLNLYSTGILYPQIRDSVQSDFQDSNTVDPDEVPDYQDNDSDELNKKGFDEEKQNSGDIGTGGDDDRKDDEELKLATNFSPSSMGFSFIVDNNSEFKLTYSFGRYKRKEQEDGNFLWEREQIKESRICKVIDNQFFIEEDSKEEKIIINEDSYKAKLNFFIRNAERSGNTKKLVTVSLINSLEISENERHEQKKDKNCIFQPKLSVASEQKIFHFFEDNTNYKKIKGDRGTLNSALLYRDYKVYAMGHGVSVDWGENSSGIDCISKITTEVMPEETVYGVSFDIEGVVSILEMKRLAGPEFNQNEFSDDYLKNGLYSFIHKYQDWITEQKITLQKLNIQEPLNNQGKRNLDNCEKLYKRLKEGIELIYSDENIRQAFYDANRAMFMQRVMGAFSDWRGEKRSVVPGTENYEDMPLPDFISLPSEGIKETNEQFGFSAKWRPFQLAFILSQITAITDPKSDDRDTTDLIWFPTGGGKTEAYLGLIAFTLFYRRLRKEDPDNGAGVSVMMRYTLRMLNLDQFHRANVLISACEIIRYNHPRRYGRERFSSGMWVGRSLTPNKYEDKQGSYDYGYNTNLDKFINNIENDNHQKIFYSPFLHKCPCCGNRLVKEKKGNATFGKWGYFRSYNEARGGRRADGIGNPTGNYIVSCTNSKCHFFTTKDTRNKKFDLEKTYPFYIVDEEIYYQRPSLLFGTVDKYAQIAWKKDSARLFNLDVDKENEILFPGPELIIQDELHLIGSNLGTIYGLFEYAIDKLCSLNGNKPKIVGATATAKNAEEQAKNLYNRTNFMQFPPPGISADDSFFMKKDINDPKPRKYIGFMASGLTSSTAIIRLASILMEAPNVFDVPNEELDKYYTLLVYFNSLKELGKFRTFIDDDINAHRKFLDSQVLQKIYQNYSGRDIELSSAMTADDVSNALEKLKNNTLKRESKNDKKISDIRKKGIRSILDWLETINKKETMDSGIMERLGLKVSQNYEENKKQFTSIIEGYYESNSTNPVKIAISTNMIATGVDITRLNVMLINGHPKSSSEYIQATSRVGRNDPGLIFSFYSATKNRDRSYYENYKSFHQTFYKDVEPSSVTPHSQPAMEKIIPSIILALSWIIHRQSSNNFFEYNEELEKFIDEIRDEIKIRLGLEKEKYVDDIFNEIKIKWRNLNPSSRRFAHFGDYMKTPLNAISSGEVLDVRADLASLEVAKHLIPKVSTMRDVEPNCEIKIKNNE
jgi:hypothetical protein